MFTFWWQRFRLLMKPFWQNSYVEHISLCEGKGRERKWLIESGNVWFYCEHAFLRVAFLAILLVYPAGLQKQYKSVLVSHQNSFSPTMQRTGGESVLLLFQRSLTGRSVLGENYCHFCARTILNVNLTVKISRKSYIISHFCTEIFI